jgi:hypothetical protein
MDIATTTDSLTAARAPARLERVTVHPSRLWPALIAAWTRHLDRRVEIDVRRLDHAGALEDFRSASRG